jgi:TRAP-type C4-dicarboxylate transport system permease large subunit
MFPAGAAGWGLVFLRVCAAGMLIRGTSDATLSIHIWEMVALVILVGAFCVGAFTPISCGVSAVAQAFILVTARQTDPFQFALSFCITAALFLLGPGAFSVDSRLFGRRVIVYSSSK